MKKFDDTSIAYVCDQCGERCLETQTTEIAKEHVQWHDQPKLIEWSENLRIERGEPPFQLKRYHHKSKGRHLYNQTYLCGPVHEESEQEYFIHWISDDAHMNST